MTPKVERYFYLTFRWPWPGCDMADLSVAIIKTGKRRRVYEVELPTNPGYSLTRAGWHVHKRSADKTVWRKRRAIGGVL